MAVSASNAGYLLTGIRGEQSSRREHHLWAKGGDVPLCVVGVVALAELEVLDGVCRPRNTRVHEEQALFKVDRLKAACAAGAGKRQEVILAE